MATFRVPMMEQTVAATPERVSSPVLLDVADPGAGVRSLSQGIGAAAGIVEKVQQDADDVAIGEKLVEFERRSRKKLMGEQLEKIDAAFEGTDRLPGFLETRGEAASKTSGDVLKAVQADVDELSGGLTPRQRKAFLERVRVAQMGIEQKVDGHVVQQLQVAKADLLKAAKSEVKRAIGDNPRDPMIDGKSYMVEQMVAKDATSPEARDAAVADWMGEVAQTQIVSMLKAGDTADAEALFKEKRHLLGDAAADIEKALERAHEADKVKDVDLSSLETAQKWVTEAKQKSVYVTGTAKADLLTKLEESPVDAKREKLQQHVQRLIAIEQDRFEADRSNHRNLVAGSGEDPPTSVVWLNTFDREWYEARLRHQNDHWRMLQDRKANDPRVRAAADKKLSDMREIFKNEFAALPFDEQIKKTPEEFAIELAQRKPGFVADDVALSRARAHQRGTIEREKTGDLKQEDAIRTEMKKALPGLLLETKGKKKGQPKATTKAAMEAQNAADEDAVTFALGNSMDRYRSERLAKGRDLTPEEKDKFLSTEKANVFGVKQEGWVYDSTVRVPGAMERAAPKPPVPPVPAGSGNQPVAPPPPGPKTVIVVNKKTGKRKTMPADQAATLPTDRFEVLP